LGEILEKGLLIGFGLSVAIFFFATFTPYLSLIFSDTPPSVNQHDLFVFIMDYGLSYDPQYPNEELHINTSVSVDITLSVLLRDNTFYLNITSVLKTSLRPCSQLLLLNNYTVTGDLEVVFTYKLNLLILTFWRRI